MNTPVFLHRKPFRLHANELTKNSIEFEVCSVFKSFSRMSMQTSSIDSIDSAADAVGDLHVHMLSLQQSSWLSFIYFSLVCFQAQEVNFREFARVIQR